MLQIPYFVQECPICGRPVRVRVEYLGRHVNCQHCHGRFVAANAIPRPAAPVRHNTPLLEQAERLIELSQHRLHPRVAAGWTS